MAERIYIRDDKGGLEPLEEMLFRQRTIYRR